MDTGLTIRPITGQTSTDLTRTAPVQVQQAVATELAPSLSVSAAATASDTRQETGQQLNQNPLSHELLIDPAAREVIYRVVDVSSGITVRQVPDEALLRLRAYTRALDEAKTSSADKLFRGRSF